MTPGQIAQKYNIWIKNMCQDAFPNSATVVNINPAFFGRKFIPIINRKAV
jgi:hypothetical protein